MHAEKIELNRDYELFDSSYNLNGKFLELKQNFFNACSLLVPTSFLSPVIAALVIFLSFIQVLSMVLALFYAEEYSEDASYRILEYFRIYPIIEYFESQALYRP